MEPSTFVGPSSRFESIAEKQKKRSVSLQAIPIPRLAFVVSEMMVLLNGLAADFAATNNLPVIFRTQEARDPLPPETSPIPEALAFDKLRRTFKRSQAFVDARPALRSRPFGLYPGFVAYTPLLGSRHPASVHCVASKVDRFPILAKSCCMCLPSPKAPNSKFDLSKIAPPAIGSSRIWLVRKWASF